MTVQSRLDLPATGLRCAGDAPILARKLRKVAGVVDVHVNPMTETAYIDFVPGRFSAREAADVIRDFGCRTHAFGAARKTR